MFNTGFVPGSFYCTMIRCWWIIARISGLADPSGLRGLRRRPAAERLLGSWDRIPPGAWMFVSCTVFVLSGRGLCDGPIPRPEESYRLWCVFECDQVKIKTLYTYCEQVGRREKDYETKQSLDPSYWFISPPTTTGYTAPSGPGPPHYRGFTITVRHTTLCRTPLDE
jgi:hypothetical protein